MPCRFASFRIVLAIGLSALLAARANAEDLALDDGIAKLAAGVVETLRAEGGELAIVVGDFRGVPRLKAAGGPGLQQRLAAALQALKVVVRDGAPYQLVGEFATEEAQAHEADRFQSLALRLQATVLDAKDKELKSFKIRIFGDAPLQFVGGTASLPPTKDGEASSQREQAKIDAVAKPVAALEGAETRAHAESPFGVEVAVHEAGKITPRQPRLQDGRAFVDLEKGEEYVVRLRNRADFEVAVTLTIDGLSMFAFSEEGNFGSQVLVPPGRFVEIPGWYVTREKTDRFQIGGYAQSAAAAKLLPASSVGVITATFSESVAGSGKDPKATARGAQIGFSYREEKRVVKSPTAVVSVRYDRQGNGK